MVKVAPSVLSANFKELKKDLDYFKKLINKNKKIKGIIIKKTPEDLIIEKDQL